MSPLTVQKHRCVIKSEAHYGGLKIVYSKIVSGGGYFCKVTKVFSFLIVFTCLFLLIQKILTPSWNYPDYWDQVDDVVSEFNSLPKDSVQVLFLGASHVGYGISPLEFYREHGIVSYNMGTSGQGLDSSLLALLEGMKNQKPKVVVVDMSLFCREQKTSSDRNKLRDNIPFGRNKIRFALADGNGKSIRHNLKFLPEQWTKLVPFYEYHSRWKELSRNSFARFLPRRFFLMGYNAFSIIWHFDAWTNGWHTAEDDMANRMMSRNTVRASSYNEGVYSEWEDDSHPLYAISVHESARLNLKAIKEACDKNGIQLLLTKIPATGYTQGYTGVWTRVKSDVARSFASSIGVPFFDLKYDLDIGINWSEDTMDGGGHLNLLGARKVTRALGEYLLENYDLKPIQKFPEIEEKVPLYDDLISLADLELERNFRTYLDRIKTSGRDVAVFFSVADTALFESNDDEKAALCEFGFKTDFTKIGYADSFIGVYDEGRVKFECVSNREQSYSYELNKKTKITMNSSGWESGSRANIRINGKEEALNWRGLNIVVYDKRAKMVLDSVVFDFWDGANRNARRDNARTKDYFLKYEQYLMEKK